MILHNPDLNKHLHQFVLESLELGTAHDSGLRKKYSVLVIAIIISKLQAIGLFLSDIISRSIVDCRTFKQICVALLHKV